MKYFFALVGLILLSPCFSFSQSQQEYKATEVWTTSAKLTTVESVLYDPVTDLIFASCINGNPTGRDGNGFIATLSRNGDIRKLKWATGMDAPKGMGVYRSELYVTDIDRVRVIDMNSGNEIKTYLATGAKFLNDIAITGKGEVFVTCTSTDVIYKIKDNKIDIWLNNSVLNMPNGIFFENKYIFVGAKGVIYKIDLDDKDLWPVVENTLQVDGLKPFDNDRFLVSNWAGKVVIEGKNTEPVVLLDTSPQNINAADFEFIAQDSLLLVPTFHHNQVVAYRIVKQN